MLGPTLWRVHDLQPESTARDALLAGAAEVFAERGFFNARITDITKAAGVSAGTFYTYFDSKEEILCALLDSFGETLPPAFPVAPIGGLDAVRRWLHDALADAVAQFSQNARIWRAVQQAALGREQVREMVRDQQDEVVALVDAAIRPLLDGGLAKPNTPTKFAARALVAMTEESLFQWYLLQEVPVDREVAVDRLVWAWTRLLRLDASAVASRG